MDPYDVENLRRSLAMLPPQAPAGLSREEAMGLLAKLQKMDRRIGQLREGLVALVAMATPDPRTAKGET
jgi:hypothetical protein